MTTTVFDGTSVGTSVERLEQTAPRGLWHAAAVEIGYEIPIAVALILDVGLETYVPLVAHKIKLRRRHFTIERPLHAGYVLLRGHLRTRGVLSKILDLPGVIDLVRVGHHVGYIPAKEIAEIRKLEAAGGLIPARVAERFKVGEKLRVLAGPFTAFAGPVEAVEEERVKVALTMLGRTTAIWFDKIDVDKV